MIINELEDHGNKDIRIGREAGQYLALDTMVASLSLLHLGLPLLELNTTSHESFRNREKRVLRKRTSFLSGKDIP